MVGSRLVGTPSRSELVVRAAKQFGQPIYFAEVVREKMTDKKFKSQKDRNGGLTDKQLIFVQKFVDGETTRKGCAIAAGYSAKTADVMATKLLNGRDFPYVVEAIADLREERQRKYGVTLEGQLKRLRELSIEAEDAGQFSAAINAEKIRAAMGGIAIDKRETHHTHELGKLSREELVNRLDKLNGNGAGAKSLQVIEGNSTEREFLPED